MAKKQTIIAKGRKKRDAILVSNWKKPDPLTDDERAHVLSLLTEGATLSEIVTVRGITSYGALYVTRTADAAFDAEVRAALAQNAEAAIAEAAEMSRDAAESNDADRMRVAEAFHRCATTYAEKVAPKEYGQLVKLGGHDGGALNLSVVNYAVLSAPDVGKLTEVQDRSRARLIDAEFEDIDPA